MVAECDISTTANRTVTFKCPLSSAPNTVRWMKDGHEVETDKSYTVHNGNGSLHIVKVGKLLLYIFVVACLSVCPMCCQPLVFTRSPNQLIDCE